MHDDLPEYAEEYSLSEKIRYILLMAIIGGGMMLTSDTWLTAPVETFANTAPCHTVFGFPGLKALWFSLFVGMPLFFFLIIVVPWGWLCYQIMRDEQNPPKNKKVWKKTKIIYGKQAALKPFFGLFIIAISLLALALWGYFQIEDMPMNTSNFDFSTCPVSPLLKRSL